MVGHQQQLVFLQLAFFARLSNPIESLKSHYEVAVIGSGYGGGVAGSRLSRAGRQVAIFERGREILTYVEGTALGWNDWPAVLLDGDGVAQLIRK